VKEKSSVAEAMDKAYAGFLGEMKTLYGRDLTDAERDACDWCADYIWSAGVEFGKSLPFP